MVAQAALAVPLRASLRLCYLLTLFPYMIIFFENTMYLENKQEISSVSYNTMLALALLLHSSL